MIIGDWKGVYDNAKSLQLRVERLTEKPSFNFDSPFKVDYSSSPLTYTGNGLYEPLSNKNALGQDVVIEKVRTARYAAVEQASVKLDSYLKSTDDQLVDLRREVAETYEQMNKPGVTQAEVHGFARNQPRRNRMDASGPWELVWRTRDQKNATTYTVNAIALQRDFDPKTGLYGSAEKSPGLVGERIEASDERLLKLVALNMASAITTSLRETTTTLNPLANSTVVTPDNSASNALLTGASAGMDTVAEYMSKMRDAIIAEGFYVVVYADTQFYLYTQEAIDLRTSVRPPETPIVPAPVATIQPAPSRP